MDAEVQKETQELEAKTETKSEVQELLERVKQLESTNARLLDESKSYKEKYQAVNTKFDALEEQRMVKEKDYEGLMAMQKEKTAKLENDYNALRESTMRKSLQLELSRHAKDAHDLMDVYNNLPENLVKYNDETQNFEGVEDAVKLLRDKKHYLFDSATPKMASSRPSANLPKEKTFEERIKDDPLKVLGNLVEKGFI